MTQFCRQIYQHHGSSGNELVSPNGQLRTSRDQTSALKKITEAGYHNHLPICIVNLFRTHTYTYRQIYRCIQMHKNMYILIHVYACICIHMHIYVYANICIYIYMYTLNIYTYVNMHYMFAYIFIYYIYRCCVCVPILWP